MRLSSPMAGQQPPPGVDRAWRCSADQASISAVWRCYLGSPIAAAFRIGSRRVFRISSRLASSRGWCRGDKCCKCRVSLRCINTLLFIQVTRNRISSSHNSNLSCLLSHREWFSNLILTFSWSGLLYLFSLRVRRLQPLWEREGILPKA
jgi:hypothetical protein